MPLIILKTEIKAPIQQCFDFSRSIDLHQISTKKTQEMVIGGKKEGLIELGESVTWRAKHFGIWQTLTSKVSEMNAPFFFADEMMDGVFKRFRHEHIFEETNGLTLMTDRFDFESPFGIFGKIFNHLVLTSICPKTFLSGFDNYENVLLWPGVLHSPSL